MALSETVKTAIDGMDNVDKALAVLYVLGVDDIILINQIGTALMEYHYPNVTTPTNNQKAKVLLKVLGDALKNDYVRQNVRSAVIAAEQAAETDAGDDFIFTAQDPLTDD